MSSVLDTDLQANSMPLLRSTTTLQRAQGAGAGGVRSQLRRREHQAAAVALAAGGGGGGERVLAASRVPAASRLT